MANCDKQPQTTTGPADAVAATQPAPTEASYRTVPIVTMPLRLSLPKGWTLEPPNGPAYLEGTAPGGKVQISLSVLDTLSDAAQKAYIDTAFEQGRQHPQRIQVSQSTTTNGMRLLEKVVYESDQAGDISAPATRSSEPLSWTLVLFVPFEQRVIPCQFDLFKLSQREYEGDQKFVESIIDSAEPGNLSAFR
jgi:hypothetical protein